MIKYVLASEQARESVDLRAYRFIIDGVACDSIRGRAVALEFGCDFFTLEITPSVTGDEFDQINQKLVSSELGKYKEDGQPLFIAVESEDEYLGYGTVREDMYTRFLRKMNEQAAREGKKVKNSY